jgi:outer membrane protein assembly factor BamB
MRIRSFVARRGAKLAVAGTMATLCLVSTQGARAAGGLATAMRADWPTFHFDAAHTGANPYETAIGASNVRSLVRRWSFPETNFISVAVSGGLLYLYGVLHGFDSLVALHAKTGSVAWSQPAHGQDSPTVANGRVFVLTFGTELSAFDAGTGALDWASQLDDVSFTTSATVSDGRVFVGDRDGTVYAFDEATGTRDWTASTTTGGVNVSPAVADGVVFVTSSGPDGVGGLFALDAATGRTLWMYRMLAGTSHSSPGVAGGLVYVASGNGVASATGSLLAIHVDDGTLAWRARTWARIDSSPAISGGAVFVGSEDGVLHAFDAATGAAEWTETAGASFFTSSPAVANGLVYIASGDGVTHAFDATSGEELWHHHLLGYSDRVPSPVVVNGLVYIGSDQKMYAFGLPNGP